MPAPGHARAQLLVQYRTVVGDEANAPHVSRADALDLESAASARVQLHVAHDPVLDKTRRDDIGPRAVEEPVPEAGPAQDDKTARVRADVPAETVRAHVMPFSAVHTPFYRPNRNPCNTPAQVSLPGLL